MGDRRLLNPGPKSAFVEVASAQIDGTTKDLSGLPANLGSENSTGNTVEKHVRILMVRESGLASLNGLHPIVLELPEDAPGLASKIHSTAFNEMIGDNAVSQVNDEERICDFVGRTADQFEDAVTEVLRKHYKDGGVRYRNRSDMVPGGSARHSQLPHQGIMRKVFGVDWAALATE